MSLSSRIAALAARIGTEFKAEEVDLALHITAGFTGTLTLHKTGSSLAMLTGSLSRSAGGVIGPTLSNTTLAQLPAALYPVGVVTFSGRSSAPGDGFAQAGIAISSAGVLSINGQRSTDTNVFFGGTYTLR